MENTTDAEELLQAFKEIYHKFKQNCNSNKTQTFSSANPHITLRLDIIIERSRKPQVDIALMRVSTRSDSGTIVVYICINKRHDIGWEKRTK